MSVTTSTQRFSTLFYGEPAISLAEVPGVLGKGAAERQKVPGQVFRAHPTVFAELLNKWSEKIGGVGLPV